MDPAAPQERPRPLWFTESLVVAAFLAIIPVTLGVLGLLLDNTTLQTGAGIIGITLGIFTLGRFDRELADRSAIDVAAPDVAASIASVPYAPVRTSDEMELMIATIISSYDERQRRQARRDMWLGVIVGAMISFPIGVLVNLVTG